MISATFQYGRGLEREHERVAHQEQLDCQRDGISAALINAVISARGTTPDERRSARAGRLDRNMRATPTRCMQSLAGADLTRALPDRESRACS